MQISTKLNLVWNVENILLNVTKMKWRVSVSYEWLREPFVFCIDSMDDTDEMKEEHS